MRSIEVKAAVILAFLFLILMRLVWMDMRSYVIVYAPENHRSVYDSSFCHKDHWTQESPSRATARPSWGSSLLYRNLLKQSCRNGIFSEGSFIRYNQGLLVISILACMVLARITTRSWVLALIVGLALLSRGRLIASSGQISGDHLIMFGISMWAMFVGHWIRSGSRIILACIYVSLIWLIELEPAFLLLALIPLIYAFSVRTERIQARKVVMDKILFWPSLQRFLELENFHTVNQDVKVGGIFRPLAQTFSIPLRDDRIFRRFLNDYIRLCVLLIVSYLLFSYLKNHWHLSLGWNTARSKLWSQLFLMPIDRDLILSFTAIASALAIPTFVLPALRGLSYSIALGLGLTALGVYLVDHIYLPVEATGFWMASQVILWWEPLILGLGVLGFYHCLITASNRLWRLFRSNKLKSENDS